MDILEHLCKHKGEISPEKISKMIKGYKKTNVETPKPAPKSEGAPVQTKVKFGGIKDEVNRIQYPPPDEPGKPQRY